MESSANAPYGRWNGSLTVDKTTACDTADILGRIGKPTLREAAGQVQFMDVFNVLSQFRHALAAVAVDGYIPIETREISVSLSIRDNVGMAEFLEGVARGNYPSLKVNQREKESLWIFVVTLRMTHGIYTNRSAIAEASTSA